MRGLTAHSGYNFYLGATNAHKIISQFDGYWYNFSPPPVAGHPELGIISTTVPLYDTKTFFKMGRDYWANHPRVWLEKLKKYRFLFFDNLMPYAHSARFFPWLFNIFSHVIFLMFLSLGILYIAFREKDIDSHHILLFALIFLISSLSLYFFVVEHRYFHNFSYTIFILFAIAVYETVKHRRKYKRFLQKYAIGIALLFVSYYALNAADRLLAKKTVTADIIVNSSPIFNLYQKRDPVSTKRYLIDTVSFYLGRDLVHSRLGKIGNYRDHYFIDFRSKFEVLTAGAYSFFIYSDDGYSLKIDQKTVLEAPGTQGFTQNLREKAVFLDQGIHDLDLRYFECHSDGGIFAYYLNPTAVKDFVIEKDHDFLDPKKAPKFLIGQDSDHIRFFEVSKW